MSLKTRRITAAIYPVPCHLVDRFFEGKSKVFVKFLARNTTKLAPKNKIIFYASHGSKKLIGEGIIESIEFIPPEIVLSKYKKELFLSEAELHAYVKRSPLRTYSKNMLTIVFKKIRKYAEPKKYNKPITMAGLYLDANEYRCLFQKEQIHS